MNPGLVMVLQRSRDFEAPDQIASWQPKHRRLTLVLPQRFPGQDAKELISQSGPDDFVLV